MAAEDELVNLVDELKKLTSETSSLGKLMANAAGELTSLFKNTKDLRDSQKSKINELNEDMNLDRDLKSLLRDEMSARGSEISNIQVAVEQKQRLVEGYQSEIDIIQEKLSTIDMTTDEHEALGFMLNHYTDKLNETASLMVPLQRNLDNLLEAQQDTINQFRDVSSSLDETGIELSQIKTNQVVTMLSATAAAAGIVVKALADFAQIVRKTQQQFGIAAGQAANLKISQLVESISSTANTILTLGKDAAVSAEAIQAAQVSFQDEFGGVISSGAAAELAEQAKEMGVSVSQMAQARRAFLTTTLGNVDAAINQQERAIASFEAKGLTAKDAMEFVGQNAELVARAGVRFQDSLMKAAAVAKKIGVDLNKVNQVGDNIIGNFEGFLESMAELGAMGFGFDATRLAEIAETGDTSALFNELRSQLAATGKDITDLRRSEQLALSEAFGMNIAEFQRLAGIEVEGGGETMEDLQKNSNEILERLVNVFDGLSPILDGIFKTIAVVHTGLLSVIARSTSLMASQGMLPGGGFGGGRRGRGRGPRGTRTPSPRGLRAGGRALGILGTGLALTEGFLELSEISKAQRSGEITTEQARAERGGAVGSVVGGLGGAAAGAKLGATLGAFGGPGGILVGSLLGGSAGFIGGSVLGRGAGRNVMGDDVVSRPGYGDRTLVTPSGPIALNNQDNVIAYADDMISRAADGITMLSKGELTNETPQPVNNVSVDLSKLEAKLDNVVRAIGSMKVTMDGNRVGEILVQNEQRASTSGIYKAQRITD